MGTSEARAALMTGAGRLANTWQIVIVAVKVKTSRPVVWDLPPSAVPVDVAFV